MTIFCLLHDHKNKLIFKLTVAGLIHPFVKIKSAHFKLGKMNIVKEEGQR